MLYQYALFSFPADPYRRRIRNDPVGMLLFDLLEPVVHGIVFIVRYLRLIFCIVELRKIIKLLYKLQIFFAFGISRDQTGKHI